MKNSTTINTIKDALITTLRADKPSLKISDKLDDALAVAIANALPAITDNNRLTNEHKTLINTIVGFNAGVLLDTLSDDIILHIPECQKADKNGIDTTASVIPAQSITIQLDSYTNNSVRYFALALDACWSKLNFDKPQAELDNLHRYKLVSEAIPMLLGNIAVKTTSAKAKKDYEAIIKGFGLDFLLSIDNLAFDNHSTGEGKTSIGLTAVVTNDGTDLYGDTIDALESNLVQDTKKLDLFSFTTTTGQRYDVIASDVTERRKITATRYQFKQSKA